MFEVLLPDAQIQAFLGLYLQPFLCAHCDCCFVSYVIIPMFCFALSLCAGIHCGRYITSHGIALNCNTNMEWFDNIVPCGIVGKGVTSLSSELRRDVSVTEAVPYLLESFSERFNCRVIAEKDVV